MSRYRYQGTITVFLSLVCVLFLSLICTLVESARLQGVRAWAAAVTDMGLFSVFGEYERELLERYDVLFLDGAYGTGDFEPERLALQMREFMRYNAKPSEGLETVVGWNLFPMDIEGCRVTGYTLATDEEGSAFYQQVVGNIRENLGAELLLKYRENSREAKRQKEDAETYERKDAIAWDELERLEEEQEQAEQQEAESREQAGNTKEDLPEMKMDNPLEEIRKIKKMGILGLVVKDPSRVSDNSIVKSTLPSGRERKQGNLPIEKKYTGLAADAIFQDYLTEHFGTWQSPEKKGGLAYPLEYILMGKESDRENLKAVVNRLLWLREGANFLFLVSDAKMRSQAEALAAGIVGAAPVPGLTAALEGVLLLAWAYGESLLDVRTLLSGGRIAAVKDASTWKLSLANLAKVTELLKTCDDGGGEGQDYADYLRVLLLAGEKEKYPMRALDMMENAFSSETMRADAWVVKGQVQVSWRFPSVFLRVPEAFLGVSGEDTGYEATGSFGY